MRRHGVFESMQSRDELAEVRERVNLISGLDLVGRTAAAAPRQIEPPTPTRPAAEIPRAPGLPLAGNAVEMARDLRRLLTIGYCRLGPIFRIRAFNRSYIAMVGAEANRFMAGPGNSHFRSYETWVDFNLATGAVRTMMGMDGAEHLQVRKLQAQAYSPKLIEGRLGEVIDITCREVAGWPPGRAIGGQHAMQRIIAEQIGLLATGTSPGPYLDDLIYYLDTLLSTRVVRLRPKLLTGLPRFRRAARRVRELHAELLAAHGSERRSPSRHDFIDDLLELHRTEPHLFPETDLPTTMLGPYFAGLDTSASTCAFMLYALLCHPELLARVADEADALFAGGTPTLRRLRGLDVTHRIALETLRMYPIVPGIARTAENSFEFGGYQVPAGARVIVGTTVTHHLAEHFPEPHRFDIDRYGRERAEHLQPGAYAPFGLGRHRCLGNSLAQLQIAITLATIVREVDLTLDRPDRPLRIKQVPVPHPAGSFRFRVVGRRR